MSRGSQYIDMNSITGLPHDDSCFSIANIFMASSGSSLMIWGNLNGGRVLVGLGLLEQTQVFGGRELVCRTFVRFHLTKKRQ
jgi:hypothetical protein